MRRPARRLLAALLPTLVAGAAAAPMTACRSKPREAPSPNAPTTVRVENQGFPDMVIYVVDQSGTRQRLGTVTGSSTQVLMIPRNLIFGGTTLRFIADPVGGTRAPVSDQITVQPGDQVTLTIPPT
ncbi:MAG: hypothetical protein ACJ79S_13615 [Gemmatimonadaceae bacterium]